MQKKKRRSARLLGVLVVVLVFSLGFKLGDLFEVSRNMEIFSELYKEINEVYVDETDPTRLMRTAIDSMLISLDPYTNFYGESQVDESKLIRTGQYLGIGAEVNFRMNKVLVLQLFQDGPADKAGIQVGDELRKIDNIDVSGGQKSLEEIENLLSGESGSTVKLEILRSGETAPIEKDVVRGGQNEAEKENVPYFGMANDTVGYILLTGFTANAGNEVASAYRKLKQQNARMNRLILDLRGNPGGRLQEAVNIVNIFVPKDQLIVEMRGRTAENCRQFKTMNQPLDEDIPLVVMVNSRSASASEIVSGALQDLDRAIVVGQQSFGKGLVQNFRPLSFNTQMKITVAKYYTPSGRCIQAIDYSNRDENGRVSKVADSLINSFETKNGRVVYDGAGVLPDSQVVIPPLQPVSQSLLDQGLIFDFVSEFAKANDSIAGPTEFVMTEDLYQDFLKYVDERNFTFDTETEKQLDTLRSALLKQGYSEAEVAQELNEIEAKLQSQKDKDLVTHQTEIQAILKKEIITRYFYKQGVIEASYGDDLDIQAALEILNNPRRYKKILGWES